MSSRIRIAIAMVALLAVPALAQQLTSKQVEREAEETMRGMRAGERITETDSGLNPCRILESGVFPEVFGVDAAAVEYRPSSVRHPLCSASWRRPNADEIEAAQGQLSMDWMKRTREAKARGEAFEEKMPITQAHSSVSLTIYNETFDSPEAVARQLESAVANLKVGITVEAPGGEHTTQIDYDGWSDEVGDRAAWAPELSQLSVVARGVVFHVHVEIGGDAGVIWARAVERAPGRLEAVTESSSGDGALGAIAPWIRIGHVHLKVADLERALGFYRAVLGFELTRRYGPSVAIVAAGAAGVRL